MVIQPQTREEISDLRAWLISLVEDMPVDRLVKLADVVEDAAFTNDGDDPFYSQANIDSLRASIHEAANIYRKA